MEPLPPPRLPLVGLDAAELAPLLEGLPGVRKWTAGQLDRWLHERKAASFAEMSDLPKGLREALAERFVVDPLEPAGLSTGDDGATKFLFRLGDGAQVEAVDIPDASGKRTTFCLSSQAGCAADCVFCVTGRMGPGRNLTAREIVGQYVAMMRGRHAAGEEGLNVVFMGMGEPTANLPAVRRAFDLIRREISPRRITLSTVGQVPGIREIALWPVRPNLAVSVTAADDELRSRLMPVNRAWNLATLRKALAEFPLETGRRLTIEAVLIAGVNDSETDAWKMAAWARGLPAKVNLIPLNEDERWLPGMRRPSDAALDLYCRVLSERGLTVTVRRSRGRAAAAACGQLKGRDEPSRVRRRGA